MPGAFGNEIGGVSINFDAIPDLQPKAIRGIIKTQTLPEENVLRQIIKTVPVGDKLFKARIDDAITIGMTPEVGMNADDPMVGDSYRWKSDQVHEYRQATKINREIGNQLLAPEGSPNRYAGMQELQRRVGRVTTYIDNRREYNRAMAVINAHQFDPSRQADLTITNTVTIVSADDKWDNYTKDAFGNLKCNIFNQVGTVRNKLAFISGKNPDSLVVTPDVLTAMENANALNKTQELTPATKPGARYLCRGLNVYVSQGKKNVGTADDPVIKPLFENMAIVCSLDDETIAENQYDINRVEQFTTADRLFYYVRYWHSSKTHVSRPINFLYIKDVLTTAYQFNNIDSLLY